MIVSDQDGYLVVHLFSQLKLLSKGLKCAVITCTREAPKTPLLGKGGAGAERTGWFVQENNREASADEFFRTNHPGHKWPTPP
jgi:hypothetical protein